MAAQRVDTAQRTLPATRSVAASRKGLFARRGLGLRVRQCVFPCLARSRLRLSPSRRFSVAGCARNRGKGRHALCRARRRHALHGREEAARPPPVQGSGDAVRRGRAPASLFDLGTPRAADERVQLLPQQQLQRIRSSRRSASWRSIPATATRPMPIIWSRSAITSRSRTSRATRRSPQQALDALGELTRRYPNTRYAADARLKIDLVRDHLAGKEMEIGRFYERAASGWRRRCGSAAWSTNIRPRRTCPRR